MTDAVTQIMSEAHRLGLRLEPEGDKLAITPKDKCPPDFVRTLKQHKADLLAYLQVRRNGLASDEIPWVHIARQVLAGEFEGATQSMRDSLIIGLRNIDHPQCRQALSRLRGEG